jgi:PknH-like extracellular domain
MLATGCTAMISGTARPAPNLKPRPLSGQTVKQVLLDSAALSKMLNQSFDANSRFNRSWFGGRDQLQSPHWDSPSRTDCLGVTTLQKKSAYQSADLKDVAGEIWWHEEGPAKVISVNEGVVTLPTAADANALFTKFTAQWQQCAGVTLDLPAGDITFVHTISDVRVANSVLAATVSVNSSTSSSDRAIPHARAIGVRVNCLVEVDLAFYSSPDVVDPGSGDVNTSGIELAHIMMDNVSSLS